MRRKLLYGETVDDFTVKVGVSRESVLSPSLFSLITRRADERSTR